MKTIKHILFLFLSVFFIPCAFAQNLDSVVAVVNNGVITQSELNFVIDQTKKQIAASATPGVIDDSKVRQMVLTQLIDEKLQLELAERAHITISDAQVTQAISRIAAGNHVTVAELKEKLQQEGISYPSYQQMIHKQLLIHQVEQSAIGNQVQVTKQDLASASAAYQAQMKNPQAFNVIDIVSKTRQKAEQIALALKKGGDAATIAPNHTNALGWQTASTLPTIFLQQLSHMQTGDVAGPIQAPNGFHVIKLMGMRGQASAVPSTVQLKNIAYQMKFQQAVAKWMKTLRSTAYIKIN